MKQKEVREMSEGGRLWLKKSLDSQTDFQVHKRNATSAKQRSVENFLASGGADQIEKELRRDCRFSYISNAKICGLM